MKKQMTLLALGACLVQLSSLAPALADNDYSDFRHHQREARHQIREAHRDAFFGNFHDAREHQRKANRQERKALHHLYDIDD